MATEADTLVCRPCADGGEAGDHDECVDPITEGAGACCCDRYPTAKRWGHRV